MGWGSLGARALVPSPITYKPKIKSTTVQGERTGAGAQQKSGTGNGGVVTAGEVQGGSEQTVNEGSILAGRLGQVELSAESRVDVSAHVFWKRGTTAMFDILIVNLNTISYLRMTPEKALVKADKK